MKTLRLIWGYLRHNLMSGMAYRGAFFMQVFGMMLNNLMLLFFWTLLFRQFPEIKGWTLSSVVALYSVVAAGFGLAVVVFGNCVHVPRIIAGGALDYYLTLPADPLIHVLVSRMSISGWGDLLFGLALYLIAVPGAWRALPLFLLLSVLVGLIYVSFNVIAGSLAFWLGQAENLAAQLRMALLNFSLYPVDIFPGAVRLLLYTLIPAAFVGSVPARLVTAFDGVWLLLLVGVTAALMLLARLIFRWGLGRYESGNLVTVRG
ncbi:MAG: ABC transporter permease [Anaerolineae bacterium]